MNSFSLYGGGASVNSTAVDLQTRRSVTNVGCRKSSIRRFAFSLLTGLWAKHGNVAARISAHRLIDCFQNLPILATLGSIYRSNYMPGEFSTQPVHFRFFTLKALLLAEASGIGICIDVSPRSYGCHGLAPWSLTFATRNRQANISPDATGWPRGVSRSPLETDGLNVKLHGASPWHPKAG